MPIRFIDISSPPGFADLVCPSCGSERRINFDRGAIATKWEPFRLSPGDTLELAIDGATTPLTIAFASTDFLDLSAVKASELASKLGATVPSLRAVIEPSPLGAAVLMESSTTGPASSVDVVGGSARAALGFDTGGQAGALSGRPVLGMNAAGFRNKDAIGFRRCGCGSNEMVVRTWDVAAPGMQGIPLFEQRRAINALAQHFKAQGWIHPDLQADIAAESGIPPDVAMGLPSVVLAPTLPGPPAPQKGAT